MMKSMELETSVSSDSYGVSLANSLVSSGENGQLALLRRHLGTEFARFDCWGNCEISMRKWSLSHKSVGVFQDRSGARLGVHNRRY